MSIKNYVVVVTSIEECEVKAWNEDQAVDLAQHAKMVPIDVSYEVEEAYSEDEEMRDEERRHDKEEN